MLASTLQTIWKWSVTNFFCWHCHTTSFSTTSIQWKGQGGAILLLIYSVICVIGLAIFDYKWEGWEHITQLLPSTQCDQMVILFFNIWPFVTMKISPIMSQICQSNLSILANKKYTIKNLSKTCKLLSKWWNFAKSSHTGKIPPVVDFFPFGHQQRTACTQLSANVKV